MTDSSVATSRTPSPEFAHAISRFPADAARGYLAVASIGLPSVDTVAALRVDLDKWATGTREAKEYDPIYRATRDSYAKLVGVDVSRIATGSQTSALASIIAAAVPDGAEVLCIAGDFTSIVFPFMQRPGVRVRHVPLDELAASITDDTWLVSFSLAQSANGRIADVAAITAAARKHGARTLCDTTQAAGVHPVDASMFDATVCHSYKWLCSPRGVAFLTLSEDFQRELRPIHAGWYAGDDVWASVYGPEMRLADTARRFDVSPAWPAWVGAEPAIGLFASLDIQEVWDHTSGLGNALCDALDIEHQNQAIVTWEDPEGRDFARLTDAGVRLSGRAGRARVSFHLWNDLDDVEAVRRVLR